MKKSNSKMIRVSGDAKKAELVSRVADALLATGVAQIPLRDLADRLDTSDRMLLYYFKDKENLVKASLMEVSSRLVVSLNEVLPTRRISPERLLKKVIPLFSTPALSPFMMVWADISARGSRGEEPFRTMARDSMHWWLEWIEQRLDAHEGAARLDAAAAILTVLEGARLLEASVPGSTKNAIAILSRSLR